MTGAERPHPGAGAERPRPDAPARGRPARLVVVVGTGTEVGKTWVTAAVARHLRRLGVPVSVRKPAQSFAADDDLSRTDAALLGAATGEAPEEVCPPGRWYPRALAPPMAAEALGRPVPSLDDLVGELRWPGALSGAPGSVGLVETAGGVRSPLATATEGGGADDAVGFVRRLVPDLVVLVAPAGLGTISAVRLSGAALAPDARPPASGTGGVPMTVVLNRYDARQDVHRRTRRWLVERDGFDVRVVPGDEGSLAERAAGRVPAPARPGGDEGPRAGRAPGARDPGTGRSIPSG